MLQNSFDVEKLNTLFDINARINSSYEDIDSLLVYILESAMRLVRCESSSLLLMEGRDTLKFRVALGPKGVEVLSIPVMVENSIAGSVVKENRSIIIDDVTKHPSFNSGIQNITGYKTFNMLAVPLRIDNVCMGVIELLNKADNQSFNKDDLELLELLCVQAGVAYKNADIYHKTKTEIHELKSVISDYEFHEFVGKSPAVQDLLKVIDQVAATNASVLIQGESGVGKELVAERIHRLSDRSSKPFVCVNCAALSAQLLESEIFGHVRGAFTDAVSNRLGRFEMANGGTIFLDEIGEMSLDLQAKLLRVLQFKQFERVGSNETISVDVRIVAATNRNLEDMVKAGLFRSDLFFRLNVLPIHVLPLRSRQDDIELLAEHFLKKFSIETNKQFLSFSQEAMKTLKTYQWPGNVRELENSVERACVLGTPPVIGENDLRLNVGKKDEYDCSDTSLKVAVNNFKKNYISHILDQCGWNQTEAAKLLDVQRTYVSKLMSELDIRKGM